jgi:hypothetical protein
MSGEYATVGPDSGGSRSFCAGASRRVTRCGKAWPATSTLDDHGCYADLGGHTRPSALYSTYNEAPLSSKTDLLRRYVSD